MKNLAAITIPFAIVIILSAGYTYYQNHHPSESDIQTSTEFEECNNTNKRGVKDCE